MTYLVTTASAEAGGRGNLMPDEWAWKLEAGL